MTLNRARILRMSGLVLALVISVPSLWGGFRDLPEAENAGQTITAIGDLLIGVLGLLVVAPHLATRTAGLPRLVAWAAAATLTAGLAPITWGHANVGAGLLSTGGAALVMTGIIWLIRR